MRKARAVNHSAGCMIRRGTGFSRSSAGRSNRKRNGVNRAAQCQAESPVKTLDELRIEARGEHIVITASARSFLHHQVRNMVGTLRLVGEGRWTPGDVKKALEAKDRSAGGPTAPASGLCLMWVKY